MKPEASLMRMWTAAGGVVWALGMGGCVAQQADLKTTERQLQKSIKQSNEELAQRGAQQRQELEEIKGQEIPRLRGDLDRVQHATQDLQGKQEDLKQRSAGLEQQTKKLDQKLDHWAKNLETENTARYSQLRESLNAQDTKSKTDRDQLRTEVNNRLDEINRQMELLRKDIIEVVQKSNTTLAKSVDVKLDEQRKAVTENQARTEQLATKFTQFSQALTGFRESLTGLNERVGQEEQASRTMASKVEADGKASTTHINETTKAVTGHLNEVNKSVASVAQKLATRLDEQDQRLDTLTRSLDQVSQEVKAQGVVRNGQRPQVASSTPQRSAVVPVPVPVPGQEGASQQERETVTASVPPQDTEQSAPAVDRSAVSEESEEAQKPAANRTSDRPDKAEYERLLGLFRDGDLDGARRGFTAFLSQYPNSDLAPNARYWLGESHYGKKDYKQAIDAYDRVEMDYPQSEKVPAAILKKGYAYLALKDKKRASSAFKQVVTLYPKSLEAGKAYDKLAQLKETR
ncbi:putative TPR repeat containing exported protein periplasmic protein contains a protein prenylyltransferase domain [Nitrospira japonica]|uniref:Putative TPR repeat containing exported protein periplasmic protein contains a protein prenylyltransferase domain n=1 Tax=Nitrospira japonica TaxID=1325564 RepID=A0A1W1I041_9BACT|nr:tol-pal system protein YbgF [Nitrospira japonica]SLM46354.1 putative TPR repeat containing exported protein periplasmic protein contains a protein prenylyltransferase domain [Nitrospira japonica]